MASGSSRRGPRRGSTEKLDTIIEGSSTDDDGLTKREKILTLIAKKKKCDKKAQEIVHALIETGVEETFLLENAGLISENHWEDIVEERKISKICGWVLCDNGLQNIPKKQYSIIRNQVFDITLRKSFCSSHCYAVSEHFKKQLLVSPLWLRDEEDMPDFQVLQDRTVELSGMNLDFNKLNLNDDEIEQSDDSDTEDKDLKVVKDEDET